MTQHEEKEPHILQIIPAQPGWEAVWGSIEEPEKGEPGYFTEPVVCWALVEASDGRRFVTAMAPDLESSELKMMLETGDFLGYANQLDEARFQQAKREEIAESLREPRTGKADVQCGYPLSHVSVASKRCLVGEFLPKNSHSKE